MKSQKPYTPVSCSLYDHYEIWAMRSTVLEINYTTADSEVKTTEDVIKTLQSRKGEEFMILKSGLEIRLDRIVEIKAAKNQEK